MKENGYRKTIKTIKRIMKYIYTIFPKYFILNLLFTISVGFTSALSIWATRLLMIEEIKLKDKINKFPEKIDTQMGKWFAGEELSKGQWQRIALGRAFIRDADIYILDEPTSSLDPISEKEIFDLMIDKNRNKIGFFITHRLENIIEIDPRIIVFAEGRIVGDGKHYDLQNSCQVYDKLIWNVRTYEYY